MRSAQADIIASRGALKPEWLLCMGWVYVKSTPSTLEFLPTFLQQLAEVKDDQKAFNFVLLCGPPPRTAGWLAGWLLAAADSCAPAAGKLVRPHWMRCAFCCSGNNLKCRGARTRSSRRTSMKSSVGPQTGRPSRSSH